MRYRYPERLRFRDVEDENSMLGGGFGFPVEVNNSGYVETKEGTDHVNDCVKHIALYDLGMLVGAPSFHCGVPSTLFSPITQNLLARKEEEFKEGLENWEPRVSDVRVTIGKHKEDKSHLVEVVMYTVQAVGDTEYLKFPLDTQNQDVLNE